MARLIERVIRNAVHRLGVPASFVGYQYLKPESPKEYVDRLGGGRGGSNCYFNLLSPEGISYGSLPRNVSNREQLSKTVMGCGYSFYDIPERPTGETFLATIPNCKILTYTDEWDNEFYAIVGRGDRLISVRGTGFRKQHAEILKAGSKALRLERASWILECWSPNYFHWLIYHLPKVLLLASQGLDGHIILPHRNRLYPVIESSLLSLGIQPSSLPRLKSECLLVEELTVVGMDSFPSLHLSELCHLLVGDTVAPGEPSRKVFISRQKAAWRRLANEESVWEVLRNAGFERVILEDLRFEEQVNLMSQAQVIFALHGGGLANMLFAPRGAHIIEVADPEFLSPDYYALACTVGHSYWLLQGQVAGEKKPAYHDLMIDPAEVKMVVGHLTDLLG